ncbi:hypothetical protein [Nonomuraea sp. NPDC049695]|uniref:hypothetical protein n=1 Tax=Nonomuraea sp. NPDC049695 TaxID=3154734 RepID=UPI00341362CF
MTTPSPVPQPSPEQPPAHRPADPPAHADTTPTPPSLTPPAVAQPPDWGYSGIDPKLMGDYEHDPASSESRVYWAMTDAMTRQLTDTSTPSWRSV